jgi:hypothetical protein
MAPIKIPTSAPIALTLEDRGVALERGKVVAPVVSSELLGTVKGLVAVRKTVAVDPRAVDVRTTVEVVPDVPTGK